MSLDILTRRHGRAALMLAATLLSACGEDDQPTYPVIPIEQQTWASSLAIDLAAFTKLSSGIYVLDQTVGTGATLTGTPKVTVYYVGYLANGTRFDGRERPGLPIGFQLNGLIPGWQLGMQGMKVGGKRRLLIPPALGYGAGGSGPIPPNANLVFDIELTAIG